MESHITTRAANAGKLKFINGYEVRGLVPRPGRKKLARTADYTGQKFGRLSVIEDMGVLDSGNRAWGCICDCGRKVCIPSRGLRNRTTNSCGCINSDASGGRNKLPEGHASRNELLASYRKSATSRGHVFDLPPEVFFELVSANCVYCGGPPDTVRKPNKNVNGGFIYTGVDRVENDKGYLVDNVVSCCWVCNRAKGQLSGAQFSAWLDRVCAFRAGAKGAV